MASSDSPEVRTPNRDRPDVDEDSGGEQERRNVTLEIPREGQALSENPIEISGTARTFENNVAIRILDESGQVIAETFT
ncbi:MAG TPA: Gmad2 immunoglobulin-like domain-containing protein, partial [Thermoanaerobaculia bacterium]|nr:Gmad2 immunoglobulin-like domain-containing protein [Thermoanaerobaculia bacterium]